MAAMHPDLLPGSSEKYILTRTRKLELISTVLRSLHWLPVTHRTDRLSIQTLQSLHGLAPSTTTLTMALEIFKSWVKIVLFSCVFCCNVTMILAMYYSSHTLKYLVSFCA
uniref:Uncharacterized protein n=1 Tax=Periophthalmus magnuspinnatus TaxID=409849 RepID=A0A3B4A800_9GOBI